MPIWNESTLPTKQWAIDLELCRQVDLIEELKSTVTWLGMQLTPILCQHPDDNTSLERAEENVTPVSNRLSINNLDLWYVISIVNDMRARIEL